MGRRGEKAAEEQQKGTKGSLDCPRRARVVRVAARAVVQGHSGMSRKLNCYFAAMTSQPSRLGFFLTLQHPQ